MLETKNRRNLSERRGNARAQRRSVPVTILTLLLLLQAIGLFLLGSTHLSQVDLAWRLTPQALLVDVPLALRGFAFSMLGLLAIIAATGFFRVWSYAWFYAMLLQGLSLLMALTIHFQERPAYVYPIMLFGIFMVLYLNYSEVLSTFRTEESIKDWGGIDEV